MKNYIWIFLVSVAMLAGCQTEKKEESTETTKDTTTKSTKPTTPNQPEITGLTVDQDAKKAVVKFKIPRKINVSILITDAQEIGLQSTQIKDAQGDVEHALDISKLKKGLHFVYVVSHENLKAKKAMILE